MKSIRLLLVEDHAVVRLGLRRLLIEEPDIEVVGEAENGWKAVQLARKTQPDVVLMDVVMPLMNGVQATREILKSLPGIKVLALSAYQDDASVELMLRAGVSGYLHKDAAMEDFLRAIRQVHGGRTFFSPAIEVWLRDQYGMAVKGGRPGANSTELTVYETEMLKLLARSFSNKQIATQLALTAREVAHRRKRLMRKLHLRSVAGLVRYAMLNGLLKFEEGSRSLPALDS